MGSRKASRQGFSLGKAYVRASRKTGLHRSHHASTANGCGERQIHLCKRVKGCAVSGNQSMAVSKVKMLSASTLSLQREV